jgi:class 3 adenylate cyclase
MESEAMSGAARLIVRVSGEEGERSVEIGSEADVGRGGDCTVVVTHSSVSRRHAEIRKRDGVYTVVDLESLNGTFLNGQRVLSARELYHGDVVSVGECRLVFMCPEVGTRPEADPELFARLSGSPSAQTLSTVHKATLAVLACDVRGYASLAEKLPARELQEFVSGWVRDAVETAKSCGGLQDGATQDAVLVYWLVRRPESPADEVNAALQACKRILARSREYSEEFSRHFSIGQFEASIALHLGEASVGNVGPSGTAIVGEAVSIALGLAELPRDGGQPVVASWALAQWAAAEFRFRNLGPVALRGRDTRVPALLLEASES